NMGVMGRLASIVTLHTGPVDIKASLNLDTGVSTHKGIETKIFGIGGKLTSDEFQICLFVCLGFKWGYAPMSACMPKSVQNL
ncbi:unnamed protein product, partial [Allacma fusca]